jgi:hypothetical protein
MKNEGRFQQGPVSVDFHEFRATATFHPSGLESPEFSVNHFPPEDGKIEKEFFTVDVSTDEGRAVTFLNRQQLAELHSTLGDKLKDLGEI